MASAHEGHVVMVDLKAEGAGVSSTEALALQAALAEVAECRTKLQILGEPPDHEAYDEARFALSHIEEKLASDLGNIEVLLPAIQAQKEKDIREAAELEKLPYQSIIDTYELYRTYALLLKAAESNMIKLSGAHELHLPVVADEQKVDDEHVNEDVSQVLLAAKEGTIVDVKLSGCKLSRLPDAFGNISTILSLDLSNNKLKLLPDSLGGLVELHTLNVERNNLVALPDTIGLLKKLKAIDVSRNKLSALPESISQCSGLEMLNAELNELEYLPSQIGSGVLNLKQLSVRWNKLRSLPSSLCNLRSLRRLEVKFNYLKALPQAIGNLTNLEFLDVSCNFTSLQTLPDTIGDLVSLVEFDLSYNQIHKLPESFGRLQNLKKVNLKDNPLVSPPVEVSEAGTEAIMAFMKDRWHSFLEEEKQRHLAEEKQQQERWLPWALSGLSKVFLGGSSQKASSNEDYLEQQL